MRNRAKCKLCNDVLESFHENDYVTCKCEEISITGGKINYKASAKNWSNFLRVDDEGNTIIVKVEDKEESEPKEEEEPKKITREEKIELLDQMIKNIENLPQQAMSLPINHYDMYSFMLIISSILKE